MKTSLLRSFAAIMTALVLSFSVSAQGPDDAEMSGKNSYSTEFPEVKIINFGKMNDRFYRGGQPQPGDYQSLANLGVKTVIDLRNDPTDYEKGEVEALGMKYINIPMSGWKKADDEDVARFMSIMKNPETGTVYVHCKAGKHRTGLVGAVYRFNNDGWDYDQAYAEMKKFNYTSWPVHFNIKSYVKGYYKQMEKEKAAAAASAATAAGSVAMAN